MTEDFPTHSEDTNSYRRAYNRVVTARNINETFGSVLTKRYMEQFDEKDKREFYVMAMFIKNRGAEEALKSIQRLSA